MILTKWSSDPLCVFIGYNKSHKGYKCLHSSGRVYKTRNVVFTESAFPFITGFPQSLSDKCTSSSQQPADVYCHSVPLFATTDDDSFSSPASPACPDSVIAPFTVSTFPDPIVNEGNITPQMETQHTGPTNPDDVNLVC